MSDKVYLADWDGGFDGQASMLDDFEVDASALDGMEVLLAYYCHESYSGSAYVLMRRVTDNQLFEVWGSLCSCYGREGQWELQETTLAAIKHRMNEGELGSPGDGPGFYQELVEAVKFVERQFAYVPGLGRQAKRNGNEPMINRDALN